ncbi:unnamed protein product, partial [Porites lobata]
ISFAQNHFTVRKCFQYFLPEKVTGYIHHRICILVECYIWLSAILEDINPVIQKIEQLFFPVIDRESKLRKASEIDLVPVLFIPAHITFILPL